MRAAMGNHRRLAPAQDASAMRIILGSRFGEGHRSRWFARERSPRGTVTIDQPGPFPASEHDAGLNDRTVFHTKPTLSARYENPATCSTVSQTIRRCRTRGQIETGGRCGHAQETATTSRSTRPGSPSYRSNSRSRACRAGCGRRPAERHGMEDARFVGYDDRGDVRTNATYTAFMHQRPQQ